MYKIAAENRGNFVYENPCCGDRCACDMEGFLLQNGSCCDRLTNNKARGNTKKEEALMSKQYSQMTLQERQAEYAAVKAAYEQQKALGLKLSLIHI